MGAKKNECTTRGRTLMRGYRDMASSVGRLVRGLGRIVPQKPWEDVASLMPLQVAVLYPDPVIYVYTEEAALPPWQEQAAALRTQAENLAAAEVRMMDADVALELTQFVRAQLLAQSSVMGLVQGCPVPHMALALVGCR